jgi:hypothetical protein
MKHLGLLFLITALTACAPSRFVRPLEKGQKAVNMNLGGPLIGFAGTTIPIPLTSLTGGYGLKPGFSVFGSLHTTSLLFGVIQLEAGAVKNIYRNDSIGLGFTFTPALNLAFDIWQTNFKAWPELDLNAYKEFGKNKNFYYLGVSNWFELSSKKAENEIQTTHWIINPHIGVNFVRPKWNYNLELKLLAPSVERLPNAVEYKGIGTRGAFGSYFSVSRKF